MFLFLFKTKIHPIKYPVYELDCTKHNNIFKKSREQYNNNLQS